MVGIEIAYKQLDQFYSGISQSQQRKVEIRKWVITMWLATLFALASNEITVNPELEPFVLLLPLVVFWMLEGLQFAVIHMIELKAQKIENFICESSKNGKLPLECFYLSSKGRFSMKQKSQYFFKALFLNETLFLFYLLMAIVSILFIIVF